MTLSERARSRRVAGARRSDAELDRQRGAKRLAKWKAQPPFDFGTLFQQRLEQSGLTEADLLELLSEWAGAVRDGASQAPWATELAEALTDGSAGEAGTYATDPGRRKLIDLRSPALSSIRRRRAYAGQEGGERDEPHATEKGDGDPPAAGFGGAGKDAVVPQLRFLELVRPLMERAADRLQDSLVRVVHGVGGHAPGSEPAVLEEALVGLLPSRLVSILLRTMALELNVARVQGLLTGETGEQRFESFIERLKQPEIQREFFREYPVIGRQIVTALDQWLTCSLEFVQRWLADWPAIRATFAPEQDPGPLVEITADAGDRHRGGRSVWIIQCRSGLRVVYKPHSLAVDLHFQELLGWLNERGFSAPFRQLKILDRGDYGWEEFVSAQGCSSPEEVARFYERAGGYLALLRGLAATDFHHENVLAAGEHPILIDLEALFHGSEVEPAPKEAADFAGKSFGESVLGAGLLPVPIWSQREQDVFDVSGLGADAGKKLPMRRPGWKESGTDLMQFERQSAVVESSDHQPTLNGVATKPLDHLESLESGFEQVYRLLEKHREEWLAPDGLLERFARDEVRVVLRNTSRYGELLMEGSHPDVLRDALERDRLFDRLWEEVKERPKLAQLIPAEIEDLWRGDVPLFTTQPGSRDLWASADRCFPELLSQSGLECARQRLAQFGEEDLKRQVWFLRCSLSTLASGGMAKLGKMGGVNGHRDRAPASRERLLAASCAIGDRLASTAFRGAEDVAWIGLNSVGDEKWVLAPLGLDLYDGIPGIGLFLAYLGAVSGEERYTATARAAVETVRRRLRPDDRKKGFDEIGGFVGWGGIIYMLAHLGVLWREPSLLAEAHELLEVLPERIEKDNKLDLIAGAAGCISGLLALQTCSPSARALELAVQCGDHLLAKARPMPQGLGWNSPFPCRAPLTGFSHGAAGLAWALLELAVATGEARFKTAALAGIAYERSLFSTEAGNWSDLRLRDSGREPADAPQFVVAWCHGAPGIGLSRLLCSRHLTDPFMQAEIEVALRTTMAQGFGTNHSLCHGDLGNLELLLEAARVFPQSSCGANAQRVTADILDRIEREGWRCGNPLAVEAPGLMTGLAGIGYGLLRCAEPALVPSVISLAPPGPPTDAPLRMTSEK